MPVVQIGYTQSHRMIAAATRLRDAWGLANMDVGEMFEAVLGLIHVTGTTDLQSALDVLNDTGSGHRGSPHCPGHLPLSPSSARPAAGPEPGGRPRSGS